MNDESRLSERLQMLGAAVSSTPSLLDDVMHRIGDSPPAESRRSRWKLMAAACLATTACLVVSIAGWMTIGGDDPTKTAAIDATHDSLQPVKTDQGKVRDVYDSRLFEAHSIAGADRAVEKPRGRRESEDSQTFDVRQQQRWDDSNSLACGSPAAKALGAAFGEASRSRPQLSDFAGLWRGTAVDKPEDGTSTDPLGIKLSISENGRLEGVAFDRFAGGEEARLEDLYVVGDRLEFKVRHRTGVRMWVTLGLVSDELKGDGIPIRSDESRCDIVLRRQRPGPAPREAEPSKP